MNASELQKRATVHVRRLARLRKDPRYVKTIGTLTRLGLLRLPGIRAFRSVVTLEEALWAGEIEPRIHELLPAVVLKRPGVFPAAGDRPSDLKRALRAIRRNEPGPDFRGIPFRDYSRWVPRVGRSDTEPTTLKTFRFRSSDLETLRTLRARTGQPESELVREGLRRLLGLTDKG